MVAEGVGGFPAHHPDDTDDVLLLLFGVRQIEAADGNVTLHPDEIFVIPNWCATALWPKGK